MHHVGQRRVDIYRRGPLVGLMRRRMTLIRVTTVRVTNRFDGKPPLAPVLRNHSDIISRM